MLGSGGAGNFVFFVQGWKSFNFKFEAFYVGFRLNGYWELVPEFKSAV